MPDGKGGGVWPSPEGSESPVASSVGQTMTKRGGWTAPFLPSLTPAPPPPQPPSPATHTPPCTGQRRKEARGCTEQTSLGLGHSGSVVLMCCDRG